MKKTIRSSIGKNAMILGIAGIIVKIFGAIYRIPITAMIKDEGIGYFQAAYPIYEIMLAISTAGLPVAVATIVSRENARSNFLNVKKSFNVAFRFMSALGILFGLVLAVFGKPIVHYLGNPGSYYALLTLIPAMIFSPMLAAIRGYYQGLEEMSSTAISQIIVQGTRVVTGLYLCYVLLPYGLQVAAAGAIAGTGIGAIVGLIYLLIVHKKSSKIYATNTNADNEIPSKNILKELIKIAIPISVGAAIMPIMDTIDIRLVMKGLMDAGFNLAEANLRFGWLKGMAQTLISLPQVIGVSLGVAMIPVVSKLKTLNETEKLKERVAMINKVTLLIAFPAMVGLFALSEPIIRLLYATTGEKAIFGTAKILRILSISVVPLMLITVNTSILQAIGKEKVPVINMIIGAVFKIIITLVLTKRPEINVFGAAIGSVVAYTITMILDLIYISKYIGLKQDQKVWISPVASAIMGFAASKSYYLFTSQFSSAISTLAAVLVGVIVYAVIIIPTKTITKKELEEIKEWE